MAGKSFIGYFRSSEKQFELPDPPVLATISESARQVNKNRGKIKERHRVNLPQFLVLLSVAARLILNGYAWGGAPLRVRVGKALKPIFNGNYRGMKASAACRWERKLDIPNRCTVRMKGRK